MSALVWVGCSPNRDDTMLAKHDLAGTDLDPNVDYDLSGSNPVGTDDLNPSTHDPVTCDEAAMSKSYIGCDYWPTVAANVVWSVFDYAVVISNPGMNTANVTVTGGALSATKTATVAPGALVKIGLPWVTELKGQDANSMGGSPAMTASVRKNKGAYHLVSDVPVLVYQFSALEYKPGTGNDLNGEPWSDCPASGVDCFSYSNDASLLLPSTAMTPNYVITGLPGDDVDALFTTKPQGAAYAVITATQDATMVTVQLSKTADIVASTDSSIAAVPQSSSSPAKVTYMLDAGDVLELVTDKGSKYDLTGSIVQGTHPVQVVVGTPCTNNPQSSFVGGAYTCDHVEESVLPIETWGKQYVVTSPTGPNGDKPGHSVRIYGGISTANLTFTPAVSGAPTSIGPGEVVKFDATDDFYVSGDHEFAVGSEQMSGQIADPSGSPQEGDPSISFMVAVEQYRDKYIFLAPDDYDVNYVDIVAPSGTALILDGTAVTAMESSIGMGFAVRRVKLTGGSEGVHTLTGGAPFGIQVMGYGAYTSYQYPGGLDLKVIAPAPPIL